MQIHHITHIDNLDNILSSKYLFCDKHVYAKNISHINIAHSNIKERRLRTDVVLSGKPKGTVGDYVPFYFCVRSPMLYSIRQGNVEGYAGGQADVIYLCFDTDDFINSGDLWCYSDGNAGAVITEFFDDKEFAHVDWTMVKAKYWGITDDDPDRVRRKQAEFLVHNNVDISMMKKICVHNNDVHKLVESTLSQHGLKIAVEVKPLWYY